MKTHPTVRVLTLVAVALAAVLLVLSGCSSNRVSSEPTSTPIPTPLVPLKPTYPVRRGDIVASLQFSGRIAAVTQEALFFRADGRIRSVYAKAGDTVKKGQVLADLESLTKLERQQALSRLAIRRAEIRLEMANLALQQVEKNAFTFYQKTYDVPQKKFEVELAQIALDEVRLSNEDLAINISDAQITAPIDGLLLSSSILAGGTATAYKEVMVVVNPNLLEVSADLDSTMQAKVELNLLATVTVPSRSNLLVTGKVRRLPLTADSSTSAQNKVQDISTRIALDNPPTALGLGIGDRVEVSLLLQSRSGVLWLPPQAVRAFEGRKFVIVQEGQVQRRLDVKTGVQSDDRVEIVEGLTEGQIVVAP
jgi:RND family efflux transporter MFP subunit